MTIARTIESNQVHIYRIRVASSNLDAWMQGLARDERTRCKAFLQPADRERYACGRFALRRILSDYLRTPPHAVRFCNSRRGKPHLEHPTNLSFNLSHSGDWVLIAISTCRVGVDVELLRPMSDLMAVALRIFGPTELAPLHNSRGAPQLQSFFRSWVRKEAYLKMHGIGIVDSLANFDLRAGPKRGNAIVQVCDQSQYEQVALCDVPISTSYVAAVVAERTGLKFMLQSFERAEV